MRFATSLLVFLVFSLPVHAQTAKVIALSPADAAEVKALYAQRDAINKAIEDLHKKVADKYLMEPKPGSGSWTTSITGSGFLLCTTNGCGPSPETAEEKKKREADYKKWQESEKKATHLERKEGWSLFEFSEDFKFVVPVKVTYQATPSWIGGNNCLVGSSTLTVN